MSFEPINTGRLDLELIQHLDSGNLKKYQKDIISDYENVTQGKTQEEVAIKIVKAIGLKYGDISKKIDSSIKISHPSYLTLPSKISVAANLLFNLGGVAATFYGGAQILLKDKLSATEKIAIFALVEVLGFLGTIGVGIEVRKLARAITKCVLANASKKKYCGLREKILSEPQDELVSTKRLQKYLVKSFLIFPTKLYKKLSAEQAYALKGQACYSEIASNYKKIISLLDNYKPENSVQKILKRIGSLLEKDGDLEGANFFLIRLIETTVPVKKNKDAFLAFFKEKFQISLSNDELDSIFFKVRVDGTLPLEKILPSLKKGLSVLENNA